MMSINFIEVKDIELFLAKVDEKIDDKHLNEYIKTQVQSRNLALDKNLKIISFYVKEINSYLISVISSSNKNDILEPSVFQAHYFKSKFKKKCLDLFICKDYFALYFDTKLIYFKKIKTTYEKIDVLNYIKLTFKKGIDNIYEIDEEKLNEYKKIYVDNIESVQKINYISLTNNTNALIFLSYIFLIVISFVFYYFNAQNIDDAQKKKQYEQYNVEKKDYENLLKEYEDNEKLTNNIVELFNILSNNEIVMTSIKVFDNRANIVLYSSSREVLLDFLDFYDENSVIQSITHNIKENRYEMAAIVKLSK